MLFSIGQIPYPYSIAAIISGFFAVAFAISIHEFSHAFVAHKAGDLTPKAYGRLTLNPFKHFDVYGTLMLLFFGFGWAKPVPINPLKFKNIRRDTVLVSLAGIVSNLLCAFLFVPIAILIAKYLALENFFLFLINSFISFFITISINLAMFNLLPIYPLDGFNLIAALSKTENGYIRFMHKYGWIILLVILLLLSNIFVSIPTFFVELGFYKFWRLIIR